jgi:annexin A7/11
VEELSSELSGDLRKVILTLVSCVRNENKIADEKECEEKAEKLYNAGERIRGTDKKIFYDILTMASREELILIDKIYEKRYNHGLIDAINNEFSFSMKKLLITIVMSRINPPEYFARRVNYAVKGLGTKDTLLIRILVTRNIIDMPQIIKEYQRIFHQDMIKDIEDDTSGDYRRILVRLCQN